MTTAKIYWTTSGAKTLPSDFGAPFSIEAIGGGAGGGPNNYDGGGGGGAYAKITNANISLIASQTVWVNIPSSSSVGVNGGDTWFNKFGNYAPGVVSSGVLAKGGTSTSSATGGYGGTTSGIGTTQYSGGNGGLNAWGGSALSGGAGGGAAGPFGAGANGEDASNIIGYATGGTGDNGHGGTSGTAGTELGSGYGCGGGGYSNSYPVNAGAYGGGGGSTGTGSGGLIVVTYTVTPPASALLSGAGSLKANSGIVKYAGAAFAGVVSASVNAIPIYQIGVILSTQASFSVNDFLIKFVYRDTLTIPNYSAFRGNASVRRVAYPDIVVGTGSFTSNANAKRVAAATLAITGSVQAQALKFIIVTTVAFSPASTFGVDASIPTSRALNALLAGASGLNVPANAIFNPIQSFNGVLRVLSTVNKIGHTSAQLDARGFMGPALAHVWQVFLETYGSGGLSAHASTAFILGVKWPAATIPAFHGTSTLSCEIGSLYLFTDPITPGIMKDAGEKVLWPNATGLEKAMASTDAYRLMATYAELIRDQWDPYAISRENLPYLAWAMGTNLWEPIWSEGTKRVWTDEQWLYKSLRGTPAAYRMALAQSGYDITNMVRPPQGFWIAPDLTKAQWDYWIRQMPELRIYYGLKEGTRGVDEWFLDGPDDGSFRRSYTGYLDQDALSINDGFVLYGRYAIVRQRGRDTPAYRIEFTPGTVTSPTIDFERVSTQGESSLGYVLDEDVLDDERYFDYDEIVPKLYTVEIDRTYDHDASELALTTVIPDMDPISIRYETNSDIGNGGPYFFRDGSFLDDGAEGEGFFDLTDGGEYLLADRIYLFDKSVNAVVTAGISFLDASRLGIPTYYAEVQIDTHSVDSPLSAFMGDIFLDGNQFFIDEDTETVDRGLRAVVDAKALRDTIAVSFAPIRPLQMGDFLTAQLTYGSWTVNPL